MARLFAGEKKSKLESLRRLLQGCNGVREAEVSQMLRWDRRTTNNYLRELKRKDNAYKEGRDWHAE